MSTKATTALIRRKHAQTRSWSQTADWVNAHFHLDELGLSLSKTAYRDWIELGKEPARPEVRTALLLGPRVCPTCHRKIQPPRKAVQYKPDSLVHDEAARIEKWWRNGIRAEQRREIIRDAFKDAQTQKEMTQ